MVKSSGIKPLTIENVSYDPVDDIRLTKREKEKARIELGETENLKHNSLQTLKQKLSKDKDVQYKLDDDFLLRFLRVRKYDCDRAYKTIKDFYAVRRDHPEAFSLPSNLESLLEADFYTCLPYADHEGRLIHKMDYGKWKTSEVPFIDFLRTMIIVSDMTTVNPRSQINGIIGIWDMKGMTTSHLAQFLYPGRISLLAKCLQGCYPWRVKMIIAVNCGRISMMLYKLLKPFMDTKVIERVILLGSDMNELHQYVNPQLIPKQFNGKLEDSKCTFPEYVLDNLNYLKYERSSTSGSK